MPLQSDQITGTANNSKTARDYGITGPSGSQAFNTVRPSRNAQKASFKRWSRKLGAYRVTTALANVVLVDRPKGHPANPVLPVQASDVANRPRIEREPGEASVK
jgi:hypothetical protein